MFKDYPLVKLESQTQWQPIYKQNETLFSLFFKASECGKREL